MKKQIIKVGNSEFTTSIDEANPEMVNIGDSAYKIKILKDYGNNVYSLSINNKVVLAQIDKQEGDSYRVFHDGFKYESIIKTEKAAMLEKYLQSSTGASKKSAKVKSPMPGLIVKINFGIGDHVKKGDKIIIIEAMKMENALAAPIDGIIRNIYAKEGQAVEKDANLCEIGNE